MRAALMASVALLAACQTPPEPPGPRYLPEPIESTGEVPSYKQLAKRYNENADKLDRLWSTTVVSMRWRDENGKKRHEQGEGHFIFVRPSDVALTAGKLGDVLMWAGSNDERYWLFNLREDGKAFVGAQQHVGKRCSRPLPLPVYPRTVPHLLGLLPLDESLADAAPPVEKLRGYYLVEPPGLKVRMLLEPETAMPVRVDLLNRQGESVVIAELGQFKRVQQADTPTHEQPKAPTRAVLHAVGEEAQLSLTLANLTDGQRFDKIKDAAFDFEALKQAHEPAEVVDLDGDCE